MNRGHRAQFNFVIKNKPHELAKVTKRISERGLALLGLNIASVGDKALIRVSTDSENARSLRGF